jgi:hydroxymethylglutaryl-CoA reductase
LPLAKQAPEEIVKEILCYFPVKNVRLLRRAYVVSGVIEPSFGVILSSFNILEPIECHDNDTPGRVVGGRYPTPKSIYNRGVRLKSMCSHSNPIPK